jgi:hypothetical protein
MLVKLLIVLAIFQVTPSVISSGTFSVDASADESPTSIASQGVNEHVGNILPLGDLHLTSYFEKDRPVILLIEDSNASTQGLPSQALSGLANAVSQLKDLESGNQFDILVVSPLPMKLITHWNILIEGEASLHELKDLLGVAVSHPPGIYILTSKGKISRYLYGNEFHVKDLKFALIEASDKKIGSLRDRMLFLIFHYDSIRNSYTVDLWRIVAIVLIIQTVFSLIFFSMFWKKKKA